jgi:hypothetical protein
MRDDLPGVIGAGERLGHRTILGCRQGRRYRVDWVVRGDRWGCRLGSFEANRRQKRCGRKTVQEN